MSRHLVPLDLAPSTIALGRGPALLLHQSGAFGVELIGRAPQTDLLLPQGEELGALALDVIGPEGRHPPLEFDDLRLEMRLGDLHVLQNAAQVLQAPLQGPEQMGVALSRIDGVVKKGFSSRSVGGQRLGTRDAQ